jgi:hypothetical protein
MWQIGSAFRRRHRRRDHVSTTTAAAQLSHRVESALRVGAVDSADQLVRQGLALLPTLSDDLATRFVQQALDIRLARGELADARQLAEAHVSRLELTTRGVGALEILGLDPGPMPNAQPNFLRLARSIREGALTPTALADVVGARAKTWLRHPELHLLFGSSLWNVDQAAAVRFWNRSFFLHDLPLLKVTSNDPELNALAAMSFPTLTVRRSGPLVSILVAAHNAMATIRYALESLLSQTYGNLEILVCDDASDDQTLAVLRDRFRREPRVRLFRSVGNQGAYNVKNALATHARGDIIAFHDADDLALPTRIASQVRLLTRGYDACVTDLIRLKGNGEVVFFRDQRAQRLAMVSLMMKRSMFDALGPFRPARFGADLELFEKLNARGARIGRVRSPLILGLYSGQSATQARNAESTPNGYRAPLRRAYGELLFSRYVLRSDTPEALVDDALRASGNYVDSCSIERIV